MKSEKEIRIVLEQKISEFNCLVNAFFSEKKLDLGKLYQLQSEIEDLCWILDIEPITKYNRL